MYREEVKSSFVGIGLDSKEWLTVTEYSVIYVDYPGYICLESVHSTEG
jgi:hypothetical protein